MEKKVDLYLTVHIETGAVRLPSERQMKRDALRRILNHGAVLKRRHQLEWDDISAAVELSLPLDGEKISERFRVSQQGTPVLLGELQVGQNRKWLSSILFQLGVLYHQKGEGWYDYLMGREKVTKPEIQPEEPKKEVKQDGNDLSQSSLSSELVAGLTNSGLLS